MALRYNFEEKTFAIANSAQGSQQMHTKKKAL
jgi:hypothetical protein